MAYCTKCGAPLDPKYKFCTKCGKEVTPVTPTPPGPEREGCIPTHQLVYHPEERPPKNSGNRRRRILVIGIILGVIAVLVACGAIFLCPLKVSAESSTGIALSTRTGSFNMLQIDLGSNQPIREVSYALDPQFIQDEGAYLPLNAGSGMFKKTVSLDRLNVPVGNSFLYFKVRTLFGEEFCSVMLNCDIGESAAPAPEAVIPVAPDKDLVSNELILVFKDGTSEREVDELVARYDGTVVGRNYLLEEYQVRFTGQGESFILALQEQLLAEPLVEDVFFNVSFRVDDTRNPDDTGYDSWDVSSPGGNNWGLEAINAPGAWDHSTELKTIRVGVIDSTLQYDHPDLRIPSDRVHILPTEDFKSMQDVLDYYSSTEASHVCQSNPCTYCRMKDHGTHCTGIIGAQANNRQGVAGVAWNAELYFTTWWYLEKSGTNQMSNYSTTEGMLHNITWLAVNGCRVISISVGSSQSSDPNNPDAYETSATRQFDRTVERLEKAGYDFLICKSAGNDNDDAWNYALNRVMQNGTHARDNVIVVAAAKNSSSLSNRLAAWLSDVDHIYNLAGYSNYGSTVDIAAPGSDIYSTISGSAYDYMSGTSMATPMTAGVAAMVYGADPGLNAGLVKSILCFTGKNFCEKNLSVYYLVDAKEAVEWTLKNGGMPERETPTLGFVTGMVQDARTLDLIGSGAVHITDESSGKAYEAPIDSGIYEICLAPGVYTMEFASDGYQPETVYHVKVEAELVSYNMLLNMVSESEEYGTVTGRVVNAFDGYSIPYAELRVYPGINNTEGEPAATGSSDDYGYYYFSLPPGNYTVQAQAEGYMSGTATVLSVGGEDRYDQDCTLTPYLKEGEMRVVLTWGRYPEDLDSHLVGPRPDGDRFHVYYDQQNSYYGYTLYDNLDVDDTTSYGPETTSVYVGVSGTYTYYVHDYSNRGSSTSASMSTSGAQVKLYIYSLEEPIVFNVPNQAGTLWTVFTVTDGVVTPVNAMSFETHPSNVGS